MRITFYRKEKYFMTEKIQQFQNILDSSNHIVFFGGAGVSTASGIPDFRSSDGLFMQDSGYKVSPEEIISHSFFINNPEIFFDYYFKNLVSDGAVPNAAHNFLAELEDRGKDVSVITQNIDGLHQKAGSSYVYELHGTTIENYCMQCGKRYSNDELEKDEEGIPRCSIDGAIVRPNITLYEEQLDTQTLELAVQSIQEADTMIIAGTSLAVYPAAGLVNYFNGKHLVIVNKSVLQTNRQDALVFQNSIDDVFSKLS